MNNLCTICMRAGSKGIINKNIKYINKKPLMFYTIQQAKKSKLFDYIVVSTDSKKIAALAIKLGVDYYFIRSKKLSTDNAAKVPVIRDALIKSEKFFNKKFDNIIDLDVTAPLRKVKDILNAYKKFKRLKSNNLITACKSKKNPYFNLIEIKNNKIQLVKKMKKKIVSRQQAPTTYDCNASIYIWKRNYLIKSNNLLSNKTSLYIMPENRSIDIDSELDFNIVKNLLK